MGRDCRERFPRHQLQRKPQVSYPGIHHGTCRARVVMHVGIANSRWWGKRSRHSRCIHNPRFYVSGKRPMATRLRLCSSLTGAPWLKKLIEISLSETTNLGASNCVRKKMDPNLDTPFSSATQICFSRVYILGIVLFITFRLSYSDIDHCLMHPTTFSSLSLCGT